MDGREPSPTSTVISNRQVCFEGVTGIGLTHRSTIIGNLETGFSGAHNSVAFSK